MTTNSPLPAHLERIGDQLVVAAESLYGIGPGGSRRRSQPRRASATLARAWRVALAGGAASLAAAACVVAIFATSGTLQAYAVTRNTNGTYTIMINKIATGVPALNAKLKQLGIDATAVPVTTTCTAPSDGVPPLIGGSSSLTRRPNMALSPAKVTAGSARVVNLDEASIPSGSRGVIAAYQSPSGQIDLSISTTTGRIPSCLNPSDMISLARIPATRCSTNAARGVRCDVRAAHRLPDEHHARAQSR
jgi:hypothetical protein